MSENSIRLGYWKIRGLAQPIRTLLHYLGVAFVDETFEQGDAPAFSREAWLSVKATLDLSFPNLPYFFDGKVSLTQSHAILRYVARTYGAGTGLYEGTPEVLAEIDMVLDQATDLRNNYTRCGYGSIPFETFCSSILPGFLSCFERSKHAFAAGASVSIADFVLHEVLDGLQAMVADLAPAGSPGALAAYPNLQAYKARFEALPAIAAFRASPAFLARPFNNKVAVWK